MRPGSHLVASSVQLFLVPLALPHVLEQLLAYTFAVSAALALINMAPIWFLDGEAALKAAFDLSLHSSDATSNPATSKANRPRDRLRKGVLCIGTTVLLVVLLLHLLKVFGYDESLSRLLHTLGKLLSFVRTQTS